MPCSLGKCRYRVMQISQISTHLIIQFQKITFAAGTTHHLIGEACGQRDAAGLWRGTRTSPTVIVACNLVLILSLP